MVDKKCPICNCKMMMESFPTSIDSKDIVVKYLCIECQHGEEIIIEDTNRM